MKKIVVILVILIFSLPVFAQDSKETLELKLNALQWEFKSHQNTLTLLQKRMEEIKVEAQKLQLDLKSLTEKAKKDVVVEKKE